MTVNDPDLAALMESHGDRFEALIARIDAAAYAVAPELLDEEHETARALVFLGVRAALRDPEAGDPEILRLLEALWAQEGVN